MIYETFTAYLRTCRNTKSCNFLRDKSCDHLRQILWTHL